LPVPIHLAASAMPSLTGTWCGQPKFLVSRLIDDSI
jgi:hypothetical protein